MVYSKIHVTVALSVIIFRFTLFRWILEYSLGLQTGHFQTYSQLKVSWGLQSSFWDVSGFQGHDCHKVAHHWLKVSSFEVFWWEHECIPLKSQHHLSDIIYVHLIPVAIFLNKLQTTRQGRPVNRTKIQNSEAFHFVESLKLHGFHAKSCGTFIDM